MIENLFDHTCDIYHGRKETAERGYGLPPKHEDNFTYPVEPELKAIACHFSVKSGQPVLIQGEPGNDLDAKLKLTLPPGTDIRANDKVVSGVTGYAYRAGVPRDIRGHHITVRVERIHPEEL